MSKIVEIHNPAHAVMDVVFLHGLDGDAHKSWTAADQQGFWPQWLAEDVDRIAVWSVGYDAYRIRPDQSR